VTEDCSASDPGIVIGVDVGTTAAKVVAFELRDSFADLGRLRVPPATP
jgi:sugar (pentulose or hexulose) kinase